MDSNFIIQNLSLKEQITELKAVVIFAGSFAAGDKVFVFSLPPFIVANLVVGRCPQYL